MSHPVKASVMHEPSVASAPGDPIIFRALDDRIADSLHSPLLTAHPCLPALETQP